MQLSPPKARLAIVAMCTLHNLLRNRCLIIREPPVPRTTLRPNGMWRSLETFEAYGGAVPARAKMTRDTLMKWVDSEYGDANYAPDVFADQA